MATSIGSLAVQITGNTTGLAQSLKTTEDMAKKTATNIAKNTSGNAAKTNKEVTKSFGTFGKITGGLTEGIGAGLGLAGGLGIMGGIEGAAKFMGGLVVDSVKMAASFEDIKMSFETMLGDAKEAKDLFAEIAKFAVETPFTTGSLAQQGKMLLGSGTSIDQIVPTLKMLGDLAMGDEQKLASLVRIYDQIRGVGHLTGQEKRELIQSGDLSAFPEALAKQMKVSRAELDGLISDAKISTGDVQRTMIAMTSQGGMFFNGMAKGAKTFNGLLSTLRDNWELFSGEFGQMIIDEFNLKPLIGRLTELISEGRSGMEQFRPVLKDLASSAGDFGNALFKGLASSAVAAAQLVNTLNRLKNSVSGDDGLLGTDKKLTKGMEDYGSIGGLLGAKDTDFNPLNWLGPGGGARLHRRIMLESIDGIGDAKSKPGDLVDIDKLADGLKKTLDTLNGLGNSLKPKGLGDLFREHLAEGNNRLDLKAQAPFVGVGVSEEFRKYGQMLGMGFLADFGMRFARELHLAVRQVLPDNNKLNDDQLKEAKRIRDEVNPMDAFRKQMDDLNKIKDLGGFFDGDAMKNRQPGIGGMVNGLAAGLNSDKLFARAANDAFDKSFPKLLEPVKLASIALKDSSEAVSLIIHHKAGYEANDPQARMAAVMERNGAQQDEAIRVLREIKQLLEKPGKVLNVKDD
jgi:Tape measure protein